MTQQQSFHLKQGKFQYIIAPLFQLIPQANSTICLYNISYVAFFLIEK